MAKIQAILSLHAQGWTQVCIAETLQVDRETVRKYVRQQSCGPKPANAPTGSDAKKKTKADQEKPAPDPDGPCQS
jgi:hypothetical protein